MRGRPIAVAAVGLLLGAVSSPTATAQASLQPPQQAQRPFDLDRYFNTMEEDVAVYDPASPWIYEGKEPWRRRIAQMQKVRAFLDLNQFHRTEVILGDLKIVSVYREIRRPEGTVTERLAGRITWVYLQQPDGQWFLWHDHTSEILEDDRYRN